MPIEVGIWRLGDKVEPIGFEPMPSELRLEEIITSDISILDRDLLLIGRQAQYTTIFPKLCQRLAKTRKRSATRASNLLRFREANRPAA